MALVYLLLGGNLGDRLNILESAAAKLEERLGKIEQKSSVYETEPWGFSADQYFLNQVLKINTEMSAPDVLKEVLQIEVGLGRERTTENVTSRTMDIDILFYDDIIMEEKELIIPHPRLHLRKFTLVLLNELDENFIHPTLGRSMKTLLYECEDEQAVKLFVN
ncbi:MAG: 2-amino-4-hydroxy-6-hydroxymethyldihydropteridine diphosphokinase [Flavobacteriales bacterium]|nr:2-amino-4-hydroxy-6-hydroxymethyldihydropteridine diphosphokinase [Flavobacteriales bacterium]